MKGRPVIFDAEAGACFGWFHAGTAPRRRMAVVMCRPMGYEALCSYRAYTQLAEALSDAGFDVLRFDYHGAGDSTGGDTDPQRVAAWLASIHAAMAESLRLSGATQVALFGMRFGATLAVQAARDRGGVAALMLWAPCASGRAFVREMRAAGGARALAPSSPEGLEALGTLFTHETLAAMQELDAAKVTAAPAREVLIIGRDDMPGEGPLPRHLRTIGCDVTLTTWAGYADMMAEPHNAVLAPQAVASLIEWLGSHRPREKAHGACATSPQWPGPIASGAVIETPVAFGKDAGVFGILSEPKAGASPSRADTAVLLLTVGGNYRVGPSRNYVKTAREMSSAGFRTLRFDVPGIGDSPARTSAAGTGMYRPDATADVSAAMDMLAGRGCRRFILVGICSGAYLAFQTALQDARVNGLVLTNPRLLEWDAATGEPWQASMKKFYKSARYYRQALLRLDVYRRLWRGEVDVRGIAARMWQLACARMQRVRDKLRGRLPRDGVLAKFRHLSRRGVDTLLAISEQDDGLDYIEFHLGNRGGRMRALENFRFVLIPDADHTFSTVASQRAWMDLMRSHLLRLNENHAPSKTSATIRPPHGETTSIA
jgi:alpha-beta hydrolase superfamily lysophospholipase